VDEREEARLRKRRTTMRRPKIDDRVRPHPIVRLCACGCGEQVRTEAGRPLRKWVDESHRRRGHAPGDEQP